MKTKHILLRRCWQAWADILLRITSNQHYNKDGDARKLALLLKLARFASSEMAHYNTGFHAGQRMNLP